MTSISSYRSLLRDYENLKTNILSILNYLNESILPLQNEYNDLSNNYNVNNSCTPIATRIKNVESSVNKTSTYLKNTIIPSINNQIDLIERTIERLEEEARKAALAAQQKKENKN